MLYTIIVIILAVWLLGLLLDVAGGLIHLLLIVAAVIFLFNLLQTRKA